MKSATALRGLLFIESASGSGAGAACAARESPKVVALGSHFRLCVRTGTAANVEQENKTLQGLYWIVTCAAILGKNSIKIRHDSYVNYVYR